MENTKEYDQKIVDKISSLIKPEYLENANLKLQIKKDHTNSIRINLENNLWRNGVTIGDSFFAIIKSSGKVPYINFKEQFADYFDSLNIEYTANQTEKKAEFIRVSLSDFLYHLDNPSSYFVFMINKIFEINIRFKEFGCCHKYAECKKRGKCLHIDPLYATACQYQKLMKRSGEFANS